MRVIGIDPGSRFMGYGVVEERGGQLVHLAHGVLCSDARLSLEHRLHALFSQLREAIALHRPDSVAVEGVFTFRNARSALILGHARGVALLVAAQSGLPVHEYAPARVKKSVGASGGAGKEAVARMVNAFLRLTVTPRADASDALAVAICHLNRAHLPSAARRRAPGRRDGGAALADRLAPAYQRFEVRGG